MPSLSYLSSSMLLPLLALTTGVTAQSALLLEYSTSNSSCHDHYQTQTIITGSIPQCIPVSADTNGRFDITISRNVVGISSVVPEVKACGEKGCGPECTYEMFGHTRMKAGTDCEELWGVWYWYVGPVVHMREGEMEEKRGLDFVA